MEAAVVSATRGRLGEGGGVAILLRGSISPFASPYSHDADGDRSVDARNYWGRGLP